MKGKLNYTRIISHKYYILHKVQFFGNFENSRIVQTVNNSVSQFLLQKSALKNFHADKNCVSY